MTGRFETAWWFRRSLLALLAGLGVSMGPAVAAGDDHVVVGDRLPEFSVPELGGGNFSTVATRGKVVVVNFWATWCGPCQMEMPHIQQDIWQKYKDRPDFAFVAIAREQDAAKVGPFHQKHPDYTFPLGLDADRHVYAQFATRGIPRTYVVDQTGKVVFRVEGYTPEDFSQLVKAIDTALTAKAG
ncbi:thiol-disulfide oxidoreductase ResA [Neoasaia chiangmaiensis NBRC 101099]|nr:TlpA disulfide reductase family protein [Neoasaia chiangmaiensis]GBR38140.1 thiol-disulfide oxidoreductase ResA [Neoasaia chiangmaiensis NBRC 101099]GEN16026.1 hypothetical protein NCH01_24570 [Neoasaia chiangmaiensis]